MTWTDDKIAALVEPDRVHRLAYTDQELFDLEMERIFEKHDTSKDGQIIVEMHKRLETMKGELRQHIDNVRYLRTEINKIDQSLGAGR